MKTIIIIAVIMVVAVPVFGQTVVGSKTLNGSQTIALAAAKACTTDAIPFGDLGGIGIWLYDTTNGTCIGKVKIQQAYLNRSDCWTSTGITDSIIWRVTATGWQNTDYTYKIPRSAAFIRFIVSDSATADSCKGKLYWFCNEEK